MPDGAKRTVQFTHAGQEYTVNVPGELDDNAARAYIQQKQPWNMQATPAAADPYGFATTGTGGGPEAEMLRRHARSRATPGGVPKEGPGLFSRETLIKGAEAAGGLAKGTAGLAGSALGALGSPAGAWKLGRDIVTPQIQEFQKAGATTGLESFGHGLAGMLPGVGPMAAQAGETWGKVRNDPTQAGAALVQTAAALGPEKLMKNMRSAVDLVKTGDAITNGMTKLAKEQVRPVLDKAEARWNSEVDQHANSVISADEARAQQGTRVFVDTTKAHQAATRELNAKGFTPLDTTKDLVDGVLTRNTLADAKQITSFIGRQIGSEMRRGNLQDARVLQTLYDGMHDATLEHAKGISPDMGKSWQQYIDVHAAHMERNKGLYGDLQQGFAGPKVLDQLTNQEKASEYHQLIADMKQYGIDTKPLESARSYGDSLKDAMKQTQVSFFGKLRAITKYPWQAGPVAVGAAEAARLSSIPGMGFVLPIIAAGKVAGLLDARQVRILLEDIQKGTQRPGAAAPSPLTSPYAREMPPPRSVSAAPVPGPQAPAAPAAAPAASPQSALAGKLKGARGSRAQSGVYGGKRGGSTS